MIKMLCPINHGFTEKLLTEIKEYVPKFGMTVENGSQFIHRTFAEYFAAQRLVEIILHHNEKPVKFFEFVLKRVLIDEGFKVVRSFINASPEIQELQVNEPLTGTQRHRQASATTYLLLNKSLRCIASEGHVDLMRWIIRNYCNDKTDAQKLFKRNKYGKTPVTFAAESGEVEVVKTFFNCDKFTTAQLLKPNYSKETPVFVAAQKNRVKVVKTYVNCDRFTTEQLLAPDQDGETPVHSAASMGNVEVVNTFFNCDKFTTEQLLEPNKRGETLVHIAARNGEVEVLKAFVNCDKFTPEQLLVPDKNGLTPVHSAVFMGRVEVVKTFVNCGKFNPAELLVPDKNGNTKSIWRNTCLCCSTGGRSGSSEYFCQLRQIHSETTTHTRPCWRYTC